MFQELEGNSKDCDFNYVTACSGNCDVLDFPSFHIQDEPRPVSDEDKIVPTEVHFRDFKSEGDSPSISQETEGLHRSIHAPFSLLEETAEAFNPYIQQDNLLDFNGYFNSGLTSDEYAVGDSFWNAPTPASFIEPPSYQLNELKIRYTKQYLLNCRRIPLSRAFPDCLLKYVVMNQLPLAQKKQEDHGDYRNMDHILFYNSLPFSRKKFSLGNSFIRNLSI